MPKPRDTRSVHAERDTRNPLGDHKEVHTNPKLTDEAYTHVEARRAVKRLAAIAYTTQEDKLHVGVRRWNTTCYRAQVVFVETGVWLTTGEGNTPDNALWAMVHKLIDDLVAPR